MISEACNSHVAFDSSICAKDYTGVIVIHLVILSRMIILVDVVHSMIGFLEEQNQEKFEKIDEEINRGAMIFFVVEDDVPLATYYMATSLKGTIWEICKLGFNRCVPHKGTGNLCLEQLCNGR